MSSGKLKWTVGAAVAAAAISASCVEFECKGTDFGCSPLLNLLVYSVSAADNCIGCNIVIGGALNNDWGLAAVTESGVAVSAWDHIFDGGFGQSDFIYGLSQGADRSVYVFGSYTISTGGTNDTLAHLKKYRTDGTEDLSWNISYNLATNGEDWRAAAVDAAGNVYVTGIEDGRGPAITNASAGRLKKYGADGAEVSAGWNKLIDTAGRDLGYAVALDSAGNVWVGLSRNAHTNATATDNAWWIKKYDTAGNEDLSWDRIVPNTYGNTEWGNTPTVLLPHTTGELYACGLMNWSGVGFQQNRAWRLKKFSAGAALLWTVEVNVRTGVSADLEEPYGCLLNADGSVLVFGTLHATAGANNADWSLRKFFADGSEDLSCRRSWDSGFGQDQGFAIRRNGAHIYLAGMWNTAGGQRGHIKRINLDCSDDSSWPAPIFTNAGARGIAFVPPN